MLFYAHRTCMGQATNWRTLKNKIGYLLNGCNRLQGVKEENRLPKVHLKNACEASVVKIDRKRNE